MNSWDKWCYTSIETIESPAITTLVGFGINGSAVTVDPLKRIARWKNKLPPIPGGEGGVIYFVK